MSQNEMKEFLRDMQECCDSVTLSWSTYNLDPDKIQALKSRLIDFMTKDKEMILSFYKYAKKFGKYTSINQLSLFNVMSTYEAYHDDLVMFIRAMLKSDTKYPDINDAIKHVTEAIETDENFRKNLFSKNEDTTFLKAVENLDVLPALYTFLDKVYDVFIYLKRKDSTASPRVKALIDLYASSSICFIKQMIIEMVKCVENMASVQAGEKKPQKPAPYVLI